MAISPQKLVRTGAKPKPISTREILSATRPRLAKGTYFIQTWGCQMNVEDSEQLQIRLEELGLKPASSLAEAQIILLNTCSVRKKPEDKAFSMLGELALVKKAHPEIVVGVCGCMAQARCDEIRARAPHVDFVLGTGDLSQVSGLVQQALETKRFQKRIQLPERKGAVVTDVPGRAVARTPKLKAFVPIQYGCDKFCTFCIVPTTRGRERSRPVQEIVEEVAQLARQGTKEITLLGQTVNSYGKNLEGGKFSFAKLLLALAEIDELERIRYMSPYPRDFGDELIATIRDCPKVMPHCHMPLQSGDNDTLKAMKRLYTVESFTEIVTKLREEVAGTTITTDLIVGFPGETEDAFENTLETVRRLRFAGSYSFAYSPRPGTPAADMPQIPFAIKQARLNKLIDLQNEITIEINEESIGMEAEVLVEGPSPKDPGMLQGYSRDFRMVHFSGTSDLTGRLVNVRLKRAYRWGFYGDLV